MKSVDGEWDSYKGETDIVVDGVDKSNHAICDELCSWVDNKHGNVKDVMVVSRFLIDEIWSDKESRENVHSRFLELEVKHASVTLENVANFAKTLKATKARMFPDAKHVKSDTILRVHTELKRASDNGDMSEEQLNNFIDRALRLVGEFACATKPEADAIPR